MESTTDNIVPTISQPTPPSSAPVSTERHNSLTRVRQFGHAILFASGIFWVIVLIIAIIGVIPLAQLIVGSIYNNACPINRLIPIYLIVSGAFGLGSVIMGMALLLFENPLIRILLNIPMALFGVAWFIVGNVWVFKAKPIVQFDNPDQANTYCHGTVFECAYVTIIITYIFLFLSIGGTCCRSAGGN